MTSNERKIIKCLWDAKGEAHVRAVSSACGLTSDYTLLLCKSLARTGYLKLANANVCQLLEKGSNRFDVIPTASEPVVIAVSVGTQVLADKSTSVTLFTDEQSQTDVQATKDEESEEENHGGDVDKEEDAPTSIEEELDRALADLRLSSEKDKNERKNILEESKGRIEDELLEKKETSKEPQEEESLIKQEEGEQPIKQASGFGLSVKKIVNWFIEKK